MIETRAVRSAVRASGVWKVYGRYSPGIHARAPWRRARCAQPAVFALADVTLDVSPGELTAVTGAYGSGKSTLLRCLAGLDRVTRGQVWLGDTEISGLGQWGLNDTRRNRVGFLFQRFNLAPSLTVGENIVAPLAAVGRRADVDWLDVLVRSAGLGDRLSHRPEQLSDGERQRAALARAMITKPDVVFAHEPTGSLDAKAGGELIDLLGRAVSELHQTVVVITRDPALAASADRVVHLEHGSIDSDTRLAG